MTVFTHTIEIIYNCEDNSFDYGQGTCSDKDWSFVSFQVDGEDEVIFSTLESTGDQAPEMRTLERYDTKHIRWKQYLSEFGIC